ncbi:hypothetical protein PgNI_11298 [Pyricularia grisea]|uniref:PWI domain-containing protein n=1 Tax=Pyricularia grisea TaxID=148305 RepID=A0A6P8APE8_PYRGI|nr:hypothetical protein PgNI_11298 [Pyricularia grisea]TLD03898.1 hypothetical protein PgNI_11298 [Pyricularia grisea]
MAYNPYGRPQYGAPPNYPPFPGAGAGPPGMAPPPGLGPPPGMSSAPGMAPPPGVQQLHQSNPIQANRPAGVPPSFQPPANLPNINFNAPVIRLGSTTSSLPNKPGGGPPTGPAGPPGSHHRRGEPETPASERAERDGDRDRARGGGRQGFGHDRGLEQARQNLRESIHNLMQPTPEEKLRTLFVHKVPAGVGGEAGLQRILNAAGKLRRWDSAKSQLSENKDQVFGFAQYDDADSLMTAVALLKDLHVPKEKQEPGEAKDGAEQKTESAPAKSETEPAEEDGEKKEENVDDGPYKGIEKVKLAVVVDEATMKYIEHYKEDRGDDFEAEAKNRLAAAEGKLKEVLDDMFLPKQKTTKDGDGDVTMGETAQGDVEVINIPLAQEDELAEIPAEMREIVAAEIAAFRERSNQRDQERLRKEEEMEEAERIRSGRALRAQRGMESPPSDSRVPNAPSGPRGQNGTARGGGSNSVNFVNGGAINGDGQYWRDDDTDASDEELHRREVSKQKAEDDKLYLEAERKWANRERARQAALDREQERDRADVENAARRKADQLERDRSLAEDEASGKHKSSHLYYRDRGAWARRRAHVLAEERARDDADRRAEADEKRREEAQMERARGMADSFLEQQEREMDIRQPEEAAPAAAPQRFTISLGAAAQKAQTTRAPATRRTFADVEGLLDDEEQEGKTRKLVPIKFEPLSAGQTMTEEEVQKAVRALAQEIPTEKEGLWAWDVKWDYMEESIIQEKLRPFVEKKVVEYLGVQEEILVNVVVDHLRKHSKPQELVEELEGPLDEDGEDLIKKLWRMVIFFTESEKRGLPA